MAFRHKSDASNKFQSENTIFVIFYSIFKIQHKSSRTTQGHQYPKIEPPNCLEIWISR